MTGLRYLRESLDYTGEHLADMLCCNKTQISKWESGKVRIPEKHKKKIADVFGCRAELLEREVDALEKHELMNNAQAYLESFFDERKIHNEFYKKRGTMLDDIVEELENAPELMILVKEWMDLLKEDRALSNILMASIGKYKRGWLTLEEVEGASDYEKGRIRDDDPYVTIVSTALEAALGKCKK